MGDEDAGVVGAQFQQQGGGVFHHGDELFVSYPGGIEENVVAEVTDAVDDLAGIIKAAVVGAQFDDCQADGPFFFGFFRIFFCHQFPDIVLVKAGFRNAADGAGSVTGGFHVYGNGAGEDEAQIDGFMVVPVVEHYIAGRQDGVHHDFVGRGGAVQHEISFVRMKYPGCMFLGGKGGPFMDEEIAKVHVRTGKVSAKYIGAVVVVENAS